MSAKRVIEILNIVIAIQDMASNVVVKQLDVLHWTKEEGDKALERVIIRIKDNTKALIVEVEFT